MNKSNAMPPMSLLQSLFYYHQPAGDIWRTMRMNSRPTPQPINQRKARKRARQ